MTIAIDLPAPARGQPAARSLATALAGEWMFVDRILFDAVREHFAGLGIREGMRLRCWLTTSEHVVLEPPGGWPVPIRRTWARFVQVTSAPAIDDARCA